MKLENKMRLYTEIVSSLPDGWVECFGQPLGDRVWECLEKEGITESYDLLQIKEKFGELRWYGNPTPDSLRTILSEFNRASRYTCAHCSSPATRIKTQGWIHPICDTCIKEQNKNQPELDLDSISIPSQTYWSEWDEACDGY